MSKFEDQLARMQGLMNYGIVSESEDKKSSDIEYQAMGADGKSYAIIKENAQYVIKSADADKAQIVESYNYIDGWNHQDKHSYDSYAEASKQFDMKMSSLRDAHKGEIMKDELNSFVNESCMEGATESMINEIARQRQIMHNAAVIMNEASEIGANNTGDPERENGKSGDKDEPFTEKAEASLDKDPKEASGKPEDKGVPFGDKKSAGKCTDAKGPEGCVADKKPAGGKAVKMNEEAVPESGITDEGLPTDAGVGAPEETKEHIMEDDDIEVVEDDDTLDDDSDVDSDEMPEDGIDAEEGDDDDIDLGDDEEELDDAPEELEGEEESDDDEMDDILNDADKLKELIDKLNMRVDELEGESVEDVEEPEEDEDSMEELPDEVEDEPEGEPEEDAEAEDDFDEDEFMESVVKSASKHIVEENDKKKYMNQIVESVVSDILSEEKTELHAFGKHPGYRKKPMELPETGSDEFQGNKDINDDSVHNEEPFGQGKGDSKPYDILVDSITNSVMEQLKKKA